MNRPRFSAMVAFTITGLSVLISIGHAQSPASPQKAEDDVIQLSPFVVRGTSDNGYLSAEATSGTRYATPIMETPFAVNVISKEFMEDFLAIDLTGQELLSYTSSFSFAEGTGAINLRGIRGFSVYKNGLREGGVLGPASLERTEVIKGPNAAIYGQAEPSGMVNRITKKGQPKAFQELRVNLGENELSRVQVDINQPIVKGKLLSRFAFSQEHNEAGPQDFARFRRTNLYGSFTWNLAPNTALTVNSEYVWFRSHTQSASLMPFVFRPVVINGVTSNQFIGLFGRGEYEDFRYVNTAGPFAYNQVEYTQVDGTLSHKVNDWLTVRALGGFWNRPQNQIGSVNSGTNAGAYNATTGVIQGTSLPQITRNRATQVNAQVDLLAQFKTGKVGHKLLLTGDYQVSDAYASVRRTNNAAYSLPLNNFLIDGATRVDGFPYGEYSNPVWNVAATSTTNVQTTSGIMLSERMALLNDRWFVIVGGRHDKLERKQTDYLNPIQAATQRVNAGEEITYPVSEATTYQTGTLFRVTPALSAYANFSSSFLPQGTGLTVVDASGAPLDPQEGKGGELGFKVDLAEKRLSFTTGVYDLRRSNIPRVARDPAGNPILIPGTTAGTTRQYSTVADVRSKGVEFDANWRPTSNLSVTLGVGYNDIKFVKVPNATEQYLIGIPPDNSPQWTGGTTLSYRFSSGPLKGFNARAGVRYQGEALVNNSTASIYGDSGVKGPPVTIGGVVYDTFYFKNDAIFLVNVGVGYRWKVGKTDQSVNLDVSNALEEKYLRGARASDPRSITLSYVLKL